MIFIFLFIGLLIYVTGTIWIGKTLKRKVAAQTLDITEPPVLPTVSELPLKRKHLTRFTTGSDMSPKEFGMSKRKGQSWVTK
jgi:hypothetical protein